MENLIFVSFVFIKTHVKKQNKISHNIVPISSVKSWFTRCLWLISVRGKNLQINVKNIIDYCQVLKKQDTMLLIIKMLMNDLFFGILTCSFQHVLFRKYWYE